MDPACTDVVLFDSHAHLDAPAFDADRDDVLARALAAGVREALVPAVALAGWEKVCRLCALHPCLYPAYGLHPCLLGQHRDDDVAALADWLAHHAAVAIGECGLDYLDPVPDRALQLALLRAQFELAARFDLPLVLHARRAFEAVIQEIRHFGRPLRGVVHSFSGSLEQARMLQGLGFMVGIGGPVTHARARRLQRIVAALPTDFLLLETDAPDQSGALHLDERNEPAYLPEVLACVARLRNTTPTALAAATAANAHRLFLRRR